MVLELGHAIRSCFLRPAICASSYFTIVHDLISFEGQLTISEGAENATVPFYPQEVSIVWNVTHTVTQPFDFEQLFHAIDFQKYLSLFLLLCHCVLSHCHLATSHIRRSSHLPKPV